MGYRTEEFEADFSDEEEDIDDLDLTQTSEAGTVARLSVREGGHRHPLIIPVMLWIMPAVMTRPERGGVLRGCGGFCRDPNGAVEFLGLLRNWVYRRAQSPLGVVEGRADSYEPGRHTFT